MFKAGKNEKILFLSVIGTFIICSIIALIVRFSISEFTYEKIFEISGSLSYYPYVDIEYSNETFIDGTTVASSDEYVTYILKGQATGERKVVDGAIITELEVIEEFKGNINTNIIKVYEPIDISILYGKYISSYEGYNFIKDNKEYIFCLNDSGKEGYYIYKTPLMGKFPLSYNEDDFIVVEDKDNMVYLDYSNYEQLFMNKSIEDKYFEELKYLYNRYIE